MTDIPEKMSVFEAIVYGQIWAIGAAFGSWASGGGTDAVFMVAWGMFWGWMFGWFKMGRKQ